jgi:hypothetical protein
VHFRGPAKFVRCYVAVRAVVLVQAGHGGAISLVVPATVDGDELYVRIVQELYPAVGTSPN